MSQNPEHRGALPPSEAEGATPDVDIPEALSAEIREFARALPEMSYYEVLGVPWDADADAIRRAFFERSKRFHPDRYFNKRLGPYGPLLHEIYKQVVAAHEILRDDRLRADYEKTCREARPGAARTRSRSLPRLPGAPRAPAAKKGRSLRDRRGLRTAASVFADLQARLESSRAKAREHFEQAQTEHARGDWVRAAALVRLALAFDPREQEYHDALAEFMPRANAEQAQQARRKGDVLLARGEKVAALPFLEEAFRFVPTDAALAHTIAELIAAETGDLERGAEFAGHAVELDEKNAQYCKTLGMIHKAAGSMSEARRHLQRAWELDPLDKEVKAALSVI